MHRRWGKSQAESSRAGEQAARNDMIPVPPAGRVALGE